MTCERLPETCPDLNTMVNNGTYDGLHEATRAGEYKEALGNCLCITNGEGLNACNSCKEKVRAVLGVCEVIVNQIKQ